MKFTISNDLIEKYPDTRIGVIIAKNVDNVIEREEIQKMLEEIQKPVKKNFDIENVSKHPNIAKWRAVYSSFGSKPSDYRCSVEALIRSVLKGRLIQINNLVDLYNFISLKYIIPAGGEDLDHVEDNIYLKFASGNEIFVPLNSQSIENPYTGEVIYCDSSNNVLCRRWNWRESNKTKLTEQTKNCIIVLEGFDDTVLEAMKELENLIQKFCSAKTEVFIVDKNNPEIGW